MNRREILDFYLGVVGESAGPRRQKPLVHSRPEKRAEFFSTKERFNPDLI